MLQRYIIDPKTGEKRFNLELFLPLGGMIIVGITGLILGILFYQPDKVRDDGPIELPSIESYERHRLEKLNRATPPPMTDVSADTRDAGVASDASAERGE